MTDSKRWKQPKMSKWKEVRYFRRPIDRNKVFLKPEVMKEGWEKRSPLFQPEDIGLLPSQIPLVVGTTDEVELWLALRLCRGLGVSIGDAVESRSFYPQFPSYFKYHGGEH